MYFLETRIGVDNPPSITPPEYFYGFIGIALAWQFMFLIIWRDPVRYRLAIVPATLEKLVFGGGAVVLFLQNRIALLAAVPCPVVPSAGVVTPLLGGMDLLDSLLRLRAVHHAILPLTPRKTTSGWWFLGT
jgi:hypothetical protein